MSEKYDPRSVANLLLDEADGLNIPIKHIALQKLLYFAHGLKLIRTRTPLLSGYFEAWQYGPVHPAVYKIFKRCGANTINIRAQKTDILTGEKLPLDVIEDSDTKLLIQSILNSYGNMSTRSLVDLSHTVNSPWAYTVDKARTSATLGLRITDDVILDRFRYHLITVSDSQSNGETVEEAPFSFRN